MDLFKKAAEELIVYRLRTAWLEISQVYNNIAAEYDGTLSMGFVLLTISEEGGTPVTQIAPRMGMQPNSLSRLLKSMEERELVYRHRDDQDKRKVFIRLTERGEEMRLLAMRSVYRLERAITRDLDPNDRSAFFNVMNHIPDAIANFKKHIPKANDPHKEGEKSSNN